MNKKIKENVIKILNELNKYGEGVLVGGVIRDIYLNITPNYSEYNTVKHTFSGKRAKRGLYKTKTGYVFNADVNGALNILSKSSVVSLVALYSRGDVDTPIRIRIA